jgi:hypothetical protein
MTEITSCGRGGGGTGIGGGATGTESYPSALLDEVRDKNRNASECSIAYW